METIITPTKKNPTFIAECDYFGLLIGNSTCDVFAMSFTEGINALHEWIKNNSHVLEMYPKAKFTLEARDGSVDKYGDYKSRVVYSISSSKAKKYLV